MRVFAEEINDSGRWLFLLKYAEDKSDMFEAAVTSRILFFNKNISKIVSRFDPIAGNMTDISKSRFRWDSRQLFTTTFYRFRLDDSVRDFINRIKLLEDWDRINNFPEDPSFYRNGRPVLKTISHERTACVFIEENEAGFFRENGFLPVS